MKIGCPKCHWATDDVDIILGTTDMDLIIKCNKCKASHLVRIPISKCSELVPV